MRSRYAAVPLFLLLCVPIAISQSPAYTIQRAVIVDGGGAMSSADFSLESSIGITVAGEQESAENDHAHVGFWFAEVAPTAAGVSIGGRVTTSFGDGISGAKLALTDMTGRTITVITGPFGYYQFLDLEAGQTFVLSVSAKQRTFAPARLTVQAGDDTRGVDFIALP